MPFDLLFKFALTAGCVWLVLQLAERAGGHIAGLVAGLPVTTAPAMVLLGLERGSAFVAEAAVGGLLAIIVCAVFAATYASWMHRFGVRATLFAGTCAATSVAVIVAVVVQPEQPSAAAAFLSAVAVCLLAVSQLRGSGGGQPSPLPRPGGHLTVAVVVGSVSAAVCALSAGLSANTCGLLAGLPIVSAALVVRQHRFEGTGSALKVLAGYADGLSFRAVFTLVVAISAQSTGWPVALLLGVAAWSVAALLAPLCRRLGPRSAPSAESAPA